MPDKKTVLQCRLADASAAAAYRESCLDDADRARLLRAPKLAGRTDWRVSRFLKQQGGKICSLSHSKGRAAVLVCGGGTVCGVDIETVRPRNFQALAEWVCSPEERVFLARSGWQAEAFYRLWCIKEALLKACGLGFPQDMAKVGYLTDGSAVCGLRADGGTGWHAVSAIWCGDAVVACVWRGAAELAWQYCGTDAVRTVCHIERIGGKEV